MEFYRQRGKLVVVKGVNTVEETTQLVFKALEA